MKNGSRHAIACDDMEIDVKTFKRWVMDVTDKRKGPMKTPGNKLEIIEVERIVKVCTSQKYMDLPPSQIVPLLADEGVYLASESTFYKVLKARKLLEHRGKSKRKSMELPAALIATRPNMIYSWDITYLKTSVAGQFYYLYLFMDIYSRKIVGWRVHECESMEFSSQLVEEIYLREGVLRDQVVLHSDNGGAMKGATMLATLQRLGIVPSFSRPRVSDDNPYSESLFKTMKYRPDFPERRFNALDQARQWATGFTSWYNEKHHHSAIKFVTPGQRHRGEDVEILIRRADVYENAKRINPARWSGKTRNWEMIKKVRLNPLRENQKTDTCYAA
jgi:transposase InsO family protein